MSTNADRVLDVIDAGLQRSYESGVPVDFDPSRCARCQHYRPDDGDLCTGCRTFLLGDSDDDPNDQADPVLIDVPHVDDPVPGWCIAEVPDADRRSAIFALYDDVGVVTVDEFRRLSGLPVDPGALAPIPEFPDPDSTGIPWSCEAFPIIEVGEDPGGIYWSVDASAAIDRSLVLFGEAFTIAWREEPE